MSQAAGKWTGGEEGCSRVVREKKKGPPPPLVSSLWVPLLMMPWMLLIMVWLAETPRSIEQAWDVCAT